MLDQYKKLFVHRDDVYAKQFPDGHYEPVRRPLDDMDLEEHLGGLCSYGVYVIAPEAKCAGWAESDLEHLNHAKNTVKYVVFDLDTYDEGARQFLCSEVSALVLSTDPNGSAADAWRCLLLENSGGKGFHIWLFFSEPVSARQARFFALPVQEAYNAENFEQGDVWPVLEVFPKQDEVPEGGFGNLVKLPLGIHAKSGRRSEILDHYGAGSVDRIQGLPTELLPAVPQEWGKVRNGGEGRRTPFACISKILEEGAPQGIRDNAMFHFAHYASGTGLPYDMVLDWCERVNENFSPPLTDDEVATKVLSATHMSAPHPGCNADWLKGFCPGGPDCYASWNDDRPNRKVRVEETDDELTEDSWNAQQKRQR